MKSTARSRRLIVSDDPSYHLEMLFGTLAHAVPAHRQRITRRCQDSFCSAPVTVRDFFYSDFYTALPARRADYYTASADVSVDTDIVTLAIFTVLFTQLSAALLAEMLAFLFWQSDSRLLSSCWPLPLQAWQELRKACRRSLLLKA